MSVNLTDFEVTGMHHAFEECKKDAEALRLATVGSEVVGLVPLASILAAAEFYMAREGLFLLDESHKVRRRSVGAVARHGR